MAYWSRCSRRSRCWRSRSGGRSSTCCASGEHLVGELAEALGLPQPLTSKHLRVLRDAGLVTVRVDGPRRWYALRAEPLAELDDWLAPYRWMWESTASTDSATTSTPCPTPAPKETPMPDDQFLTLDGRPTVRVERRYPHPIEKVWRGRHDARAPRPVVPSPGRGRPAARRGDALRRVRGRRRGAGCVEAVERAAAADVHVGHRPADVRAGAGRRRHDGSRWSTRSTTAPARRASPPAGRCASPACAACSPASRCPQPDRGIARHEELVHEFGLDQPEVTETDGRWTVRFERQLTCPAEVAWDLWFGTDQTTGEQRQAPAVGEPLTPYMAPDVVIGTMTEVDAAPRSWRSTWPRQADPAITCASS